MLLSSEQLHRVESEITMIDDIANSYNSGRQTSCATLSIRAGLRFCVAVAVGKNYSSVNAAFIVPQVSACILPLTDFQLGEKQNQFSFPLEHPALSSFKLYTTKGSVST